MPSADGYMSTSAKMSLADIALALRDEQVQAKIVHYRADLETNSELDAVTAQVVRELEELRAKVPQGAAPPVLDRSQLEIELIQSLKEGLGRIFPKGKLAIFAERKLAEVAKRFARLFFESELHDKIRGTAGETKAMRFPEQVLYHLLMKNQELFLKQLDGFEYASDTVKARAQAELVDILKGLRNDFLARTTPELNQLVKYLNEVLSKFFTDELPQSIGELAWEVVKEARLADARDATYKIDRSAFFRFRQAFEKRFLQRLVPFAADEMLKRVRSSDTPFREETIRLVADPHIFSELCEVFCEAIYDMLYNDGFLDLPNDWRARAQPGSP